MAIETVLLPDQVGVRKTTPRVLVILPCYNESASIAAVLGEIKKLDGPFHTVVIDDGSTDDTYPVARQISPTVRHIENLGIGCALQTGMKYAYQGGYDLCIQVDGDGQHPPAQIQELLDAYRVRPTNLIVGSRFIGRKTFRSTRMRRFGSRLIRVLLKGLFGIRVTDPTSGFRLFDRKAMAVFSESYPQDFPEPISLASAFTRGLTVGEVPIEMRAREHGKSSIRGLISGIYMFRVFAYILLFRLQVNRWSKVGV